MMKFPMKKIIVVVILSYILFSLLSPFTNMPGIILSIGQSWHGNWTFIDSSPYSIDLVGEKVGSLQEQSFAGWYTDTAVADPDTGTIIIAWARWNVDSSGNDYIYLAFFKPVDADGDGYPEAYQKTIKLVGYTLSLESLDSLTLGTINGQKYVLLTWTYYDSTEKNNVAGAIYSIDGTFQWKGNIRSTTYYEEYSRSCYVPAYNSNNGGFLIVWYTSYDASVDGKWLYYDTTNGWTLTTVFDIAYTNNLYYEKADQMLCIGGSSKALVVFRKWDSAERYPDLYAALVDTSNNVKEVSLWDYNGAEETVGVRGAYLYNLFLVPLLSGAYVRYDVVAEADGTVYHRDYVTSNGAYPYAIAAGDRFVLAWIDYYNDADGEPKVANIDTSQLYIHPQYGVSITGGDSYEDKHPLIAYYESGTNDYVLYVWSSKSSTSYDIKYAIVSLGDPADDPSVVSTGTLVELSYDQIAVGLGLSSENQFVVVFNDTSDREEDLLAYTALPGIEDITSITLYELPRDATTYKDTIINLISNAENRIYIAVAFWDEGDNPCSTAGTIAYALVDKKNSNPSIDIRVILDNDTHNDVVKTCLLANGISVIDDSSAVDENHIMHDKFMVVDDSKVIVATVNFITDDFNKNNNTAIYIESKAVAYFYEQEFLQMWNNGNGLFGSSKTRDYSFIAFTSYDTRTIVFEGYFSPQSYGDLSRIPNVVHGFINRSTGSVFFASYIFTISGWVTPVYNAIVAANSRGVRIRGVFDEEMNVDSPGKRLYWFIDNGVPVAIDIHPYKMHAKLFVIDNNTAIIGSWNPTKTATTVHDENILVIRDSDTVNGFAKQLADYISAMYSDTNGFAGSPYQYNPPHLVITKVQYYPDTSGNPDHEWVEIYNPTDTVVDLSNYVIGDSENLIDGDDEGLYKFPEGASIGAHAYIIVAYSAQTFQEDYGFKPDYEIAGDDPSVPDLTPYDTSKFTGSWNLDDNGDEVILAEDTNGFLIVVDAVWYGSSTYMETSIGRPNSAQPLDTSTANPGDGIVDKYLAGISSTLDAIRMSDKYVLQTSPQPVPEPAIIAMITVVIVLAVIIILYKKRIGFL